MNQWLLNNEDAVFFLYGLAFFMMGIAILFQPKKGSEFKIANVLWLLSAFGIIHGLSEWVDMWEIIKKINLAPVSFLVIIVSFFFLFEFGRQFLHAMKHEFPPVLQRSVGFLKWWTSPVLLLVIITLSFISTDFWNTGAALARYFLAFPGGVIAGTALILYYHYEKDKSTLFRSGRYALFSGMAFIVYGILGGLVVQKGAFFPSNVLNTAAFISATGIPVQVFRAICAVVIALSISTMLNIFNLERARQKEHMLDELDKKNRELEKFDKLKSEFLSMVSHELKTPLTVIVGFANTLSHLGLSVEQRVKYLSIIESEGKRLGLLVKDYLDISMIEMGTLPMPKVLSNIPHLVGETLESLAPPPNISVKLDFPGQFPEVMANRDRIKQVLINILDNIFKYSPDGGTVKITGEDEEDCVRICIRDEGPGIPKEELQKIFDKFYRIREEHQQPVNGAGLGLAIAKGIIEVHHGTIWAESEKGKGSRFCFTLPKKVLAEHNN